MKFGIALALMSAAMGLSRRLGGWFKTPKASPNSYQFSKRVHSNQRQRRKDRRRAHAAGYKKAFN